MIVGPEHQYTLFFNAETGELLECGLEMDGCQYFNLENFGTVWFIIGEL